MKDLDLQPMDLNTATTQGVTTSARNTRGISDVAIAEQFCTVAADLRSILQTMRLSVDLQREMVQSLETNNKKLDESINLLKDTTKGIEKTSNEIGRSINVIQDGINKNDAHIIELNRNSRLIVRSIMDDNDYEKLSSKIEEELHALCNK